MVTSEWRRYTALQIFLFLELTITNHYKHNCLKNECHFNYLFQLIIKYVNCRLEVELSFKYNQYCQ